jgi:hypothetical protein
VAVWAAPPPSPKAVSTHIGVFIDGQKVLFDVPPVMHDGTVYVPLRGVFERMKAQVSYDAATGFVTASRHGTTIVVKVGDRFAKVNGDNVVLVNPVGMMQNRCFVPLRFLSQELGMNVEWNPGTGVVNIHSAPASEE